MKSPIHPAGDLLTNFTHMKIEYFQDACISFIPENEQDKAYLFLFFKSAGYYKTKNITIDYSYNERDEKTEEINEIHADGDWEEVKESLGIDDDENFGYLDFCQINVTALNIHSSHEYL